VGSVDPTWVVENLFVDSLMFLKVLPRDVHELLDLGTGAGFPGVPLKIVWPELRLTLVEPRSRRVSFLSALVRELELGHVRVIQGRAEALVNHPDVRVDAVVMRCAGPVDAMFPVAANLVKPGGIVIATGPPAAAAGPTHGEWVGVSGPHGTRRFAVLRV
jgi:16S rRNA (guanine527-N7)-methyltransferase